MTTERETWDDNGSIVSVAWLRAHLDDPGVRVVDVRPFGQYAAGHIPGAINADLYALKLHSSDPEAIADFDDRVTRLLRGIGVRAGERVVFYEEITGTSAARGVWLLDYAGQRRGALLDGGLIAWVEVGGAITREIPESTAGDFELAPDRATLATADEVLAVARGQTAGALLDTRNDQEYAAGTIPGAVHLEWVRQLTPRGALRPPAALRTLYAAAGITPDPAKPVITYCASGYRAAHAYVVLRALGYPWVRNYAPSWGEWVRRPDLPVAAPDEGI